MKTFIYTIHCCIYNLRKTFFAPNFFFFNISFIYINQICIYIRVGNNRLFYNTWSDLQSITSENIHSRPTLYMNNVKRANVKNKCRRPPFDARIIRQTWHTLLVQHLYKASIITDVRPGAAYSLSLSP